MFNLVRSLMKKRIQIVQNFDQINTDRDDTLIVYRDKYLITNSLYKKLEADFKSGKPFNWLFS
jgi:hypothetical protein